MSKLADLASSGTSAGRVAESAAADAVRFTPDQVAAIEDRGGDLYVTAAAGSGKTAVLTERVFGLITQEREDDRPPVTLDRLLIITFTRKAAAELKERIEKRIEDELAKHPDSLALHRALDVMPQANIMTIDAFYERLVRRHFHRAGVPPSFVIAEDDQAAEIGSKATMQVLERWAGGSEPRRDAFERLLEGTVGVGGGRHLETLAGHVREMRSFWASLDDPTGWRLGLRERLRSARSATSLADLPETEGALETLARSIEDLAEGLTKIAQAGRREIPGADEKKLKLWDRTAAGMLDLARSVAPQEAGAEGSAGAEQLSLALEWFQAPEHAFLTKLQNKGNCGEALYKSGAFNTKTLASYGKTVERWKERWVRFDVRHRLRASRAAAEEALTLLDLAEEVEEAADRMKRELGLLTFSDLSRAALRVLTSEGGVGPSEVADEYQKHFEYVLVDEYQDVSRLQDAIIGRVSRTEETSPLGRRNLFLVGDPKQSIYRFRRADPSVFRDKLEASALERPDARTARRVSLHGNFRSRAGIIECVNATFERLFCPRVGDIRFGDEVRLTAEREEHVVADPECVELHWLCRKSMGEDGGGAGDRDDKNFDANGDSDAPEESLSSIEREGRVIAHRIHELTHPERGLRIRDKSARGGVRVARPSDCAILVRGLPRAARASEAWVTTLRRCGVRAVPSKGESSLGAPELAAVVDALKLAENPLDDIAMATVLRSPMVGLSDNELLAIRATASDESFAAAALGCAGSPELGPSTEEKIGEFLARLDRWRTLAVQGDPEKLLNEILISTSYEAHLAGRAEGEIALQNLDALRSRARQRADRPGAASGVTEFLASLGAEAGARVSSEGGGELPDDAVHLMTIHASKGLEFPIVFLARLGHAYRHVTANELRFDRHSRMSVPAIDPEKRIRLQSLESSAMLDEEIRAERGEELRLLYVAMTRAKEKLILIAERRNLEGHEETMRLSPAGICEPVPPLFKLRASSPIELLGPILHSLRAKGLAPWLRIEEHRETEPLPQSIQLPRIEAALTEPESGEAAWRAAREEFAQIFGVADPAGAGEGVSETPLRVLGQPSAEDLVLERTQFKMNASEVGYDEDDRIVRRPELGERKERLSFDEGDSLPAEPGPNGAGGAPQSGEPSAEVRGRIVHKLMEHLDLKGPLDQEDLVEQARALLTRGLIEAETDASFEAMPFEGIARFFTTELGRKLRARPGAVLRELPFTYSESAAELRSVAEALAEGVTTDREFLVQGRIDCVVDEGDCAIVIDYKSNKITSERRLEELTERYHGQVKTYCRALELAWEIREVQGYLVFLDQGVCVRVV